RRGRYPPQKRVWPSLQKLGLPVASGVELDALLGPVELIRDRRHRVRLHGVRHVIALLRRRSAARPAETRPLRVYPWQRCAPLSAPAVWPGSLEPWHGPSAG